MDLASLEIRMSRSENLPVLPQAVSTILRLADDPNASQRDMEKAFERDPAITAKILKVANSAYYGGGNIPTIGRSISFLGITTIKSLVVGVAFQQVTSNKSQSQYFDKIEFWRHSLATAVAARILGKLKNPARAEELYCCGMMHDIGLLVLDRFMPEELDKAIAHSQATGVPPAKAEQEIMGFDHAQVGEILAKSWNLSSLIQNGIRYHHEPQVQNDDQSTTALIAVANGLAYACGFRNQAGDRAPAVNPSMIKAVGIPEEQFEIILQVIVAEVEKTESSFQMAA